MCDDGQLRAAWRVMAVAVLASGLVGGVVIIPTNRSSDIVLPAYAWNEFLGVTPRNFGPEAVDMTVSGLIYRCDADLCDPNLVLPADFTGVVVYISQPIVCPYFIAYDKIADRNATAIIRAAPFSAGDFYYLRSQDDTRTDRNNRVVLVQLLLNQIGNDDAVLAPGTWVRVRADLDPDIVVRRAWWFQLWWRWSPSLISLGSAALSAQFLVGHARLMRTARRRSVTLVHVALVLALVRCLIVGLFMALGGFWTDPTLSYEVQYGLGSGLTAWENAISIVSARFWHRVISRSDESARSPIYSGAAAALLTLFCVGTEIYVTYLMVTLQETLGGVNVKFLYFGVILVLSMTIWVYFLLSNCLFQIRMRRSAAAVQAAAASSERFIDRLRRLILLSCVFMLLYLIAFVWTIQVLTTDSDQALINIGMTIANNSLSLKAVVTILMLRPRPSNKADDYRPMVRTNQVAQAPTPTSQETSSSARTTKIMLLRKSNDLTS